MPRIALILALLAWVLSCLDVVSYVRARESEQLATVASKHADEALAAREGEASIDNDDARRKTERAEIIVQTDEQMLSSAQASGHNTTREQQVLAADKAALAADRVMQYTYEDFARNNPNPQVSAARDQSDLYQKTIADWAAVRHRDALLARPLAALWLVVLLLAVLSFRRPAAAAHAHTDTSAHLGMG